MTSMTLSIFIWTKSGTDVRVRPEPPLGRQSLSSGGRGRIIDQHFGISVSGCISLGQPHVVGSWQGVHGEIISHHEQSLFVVK